jgi:hypothetical protein
VQKLKSTLHVALRVKWQLDYKTQSKLRQYYSTTQMELYGGKYPNPLKSFISTVPRHTLSKLFQLRTGHGAIKKYLQMSGSQVLRLVTATFFADGSLDQSSLLKFY